jgi:DNA-binding NtrC family response regulator
MNILWLSDSESTPSFRIPDCNWQTCESLSEALFQIESQPEADSLCFIQLPYTEEKPEEAVYRLRLAKKNLAIIFVHRCGSAAEAVDLIKAGAYDYLDRMPDSATMLALIQKVRGLHCSPAERVQSESRANLVGNSPAMDHVTSLIDLIASRRSTVLILGETGTGKEVVARCIHEASPRSGRAMVAVNCPAIPQDLLEAELFGHVKGAFTGAMNSRIGLFEQAHESTLFIDEIGDLPLELQAKLLRVLQEREFRRVGGTETIKVDVRVIAATNCDLLEKVKHGKFREDLYYRLNVVPINMPPLRNRRSDIPRLVHHFIKKVCEQERLAFKSISEEALMRLCEYGWPGNVRQLENAIEMAVVLSGDRTVLGSADFPLPPDTTRKRALDLESDKIVPLPENGLDFEQVIGRIELNLLEQALQRAKGNKKAAASILGLKRTTLAAKLKSLESLTTSGY